MSALVAIAAVSGLAAALAAVLTIARRFIANYGECVVTINDDKKLTVEGGSSLLDSLTQNKIFIPSACGGRGTCAYCKVRVLDGGGPLLPTEEPYIDADERKENVRLSCQVKVRNDISIRIPEELFNVREFEGKCIGIKDLTRDIKEFRIELTEPPEIDYVPGQYIQLFTPEYDGNEEVYRAYSISSDPAEKNVVELVIRLVPGGICTTWCFERLKEGDSVRFNGPYGKFRLSETTAPMIFIAGGSGMAPIKCLLHQMKNEGVRRKAIFFFGGRTVGDLFYDDIMKSFEDDLHDFTYVPVAASPAEGEHWDGETGLVTEACARMIEDASEYEGYLCGSPGLLKASVKTLTGLGIHEDRIFYDSFA